MVELCGIKISKGDIITLFVAAIAVLVFTMSAGCISPKQMSDVQAYRMEANASQKFLNEWGR